MRKRRNISRKIITGVLTLSLAVSAFFYVPISASAEAGVVGGTSSATVTYNKSEDAIYYGNTYLGEEFEYYESGHYPDDYSSGDSNTNRFYYQGKRQQIFTSSASYYGYAVTFTRTTKTTLTYDNAMKYYWCVGTATDLLNGSNVGGLIDASSFTVWVPTENSVQPIHMAPFFLFSVVSFVHDGLVSDVETGSYAINCKYTVKYVGYKTKSEYETAMSEISSKLDNIDSSINDASLEIQENMQAQTDTITSGFDSSSGNSANATLDKNLTDYQTASDSLFNTSSDGLNNFEFKNITSYSAIVTSLSFINTVMASVFTAVGGESGPYGVVLSLLFSIVLVSLVIGLYKYYQNKKG